MKTREGNYYTDTHRQCTHCGEMFERVGADTMRICKVCNSNRVKAQTDEKKMLRRAKVRAKKNGLDFNLELGDINIPSHCPILGLELKCHKGRAGGEKCSPALDRIDSSKGYTKGNVWVISHLANMMKSCANNEELLKFSEYFVKQLG